MNEEAMRKALKECIKLKGKEILADKSVFKNVIQDMLPGLGLQKERNLLIIAAENFSLGQKLLEAPPHNEAREYVFKRLLQELAEGGLSREAAIAVMQSFTMALGWKVNVTVTDVSPISPSLKTAQNTQKPIHPKNSFGPFIADKANKESAYYCRSDLTDVIVPNGVACIGREAFKNCRSLKKIVISDSVKYIGESAFIGCCSLTDIKIPNSVISIGDYAFFGCKRLIVNVPDSVASIGANAFFVVKLVYYSGPASGSPWGAEEHMKGKAPSPAHSKPAPTPDSQPQSVEPDVSDAFSRLWQSLFR